MRRRGHGLTREMGEGIRRSNVSGQAMQRMQTRRGYFLLFLSWAWLRLHAVVDGMKSLAATMHMRRWERRSTGGWAATRVGKQEHAGVGRPCLPENWRFQPPTHAVTTCKEGKENPPCHAREIRKIDLGISFFLESRPK
jgi:hypothetical protein